MSDGTDPSTREVEELRTELRRVASAATIAIACSVSVAIATPIMITVTVSKYLRPEWMQDRQTLVAFWVVVLLLSVVVSWTSIRLVRRRTARLP